MERGQRPRKREIQRFVWRKPAIWACYDIYLLTLHQLIGDYAQYTNNFRFLLLPRPATTVLPVPQLVLTFTIVFTSFYLCGPDGSRFSHLVAKSFLETKLSSVLLCFFACFVRKSDFLTLSTVAGRSFSVSVVWPVLCFALSKPFAILIKLAGLTGEQVTVDNHGVPVRSLSDFKPERVRRRTWSRSRRGEWPSLFLRRLLIEMRCSLPTFKRDSGACFGRIDGVGQRCATCGLR